jgi:RimJ/RimL family protein N-acetyltransferase
MHSMDDAGPVPTLRTERLLLRGWRPADLEPFAVLSADPEVGAFLGGPLTREESDALVDRIVAGWRDHGYGLWAVVRHADDGLLGFTGLSRPSWAPEPEPEIGWRFARHAWGHGYATEAARAAMRFAFDRLALGGLVSYSAVTNVRSRRVMERLGMHRDETTPCDFLHPRLPDGHPLQPHVTYRLSRAEWLASMVEPRPGPDPGLASR